MVMGLVAFFMIANQLGGFAEASRQVMEASPQHLARDGLIGKSQFLTYCFVPLSVGMFPHLFQHWLTAKNANSFKLTVVAHPICIMLVWLPCILIGIWALGAGIKLPPDKAGAVLGIMVNKLNSPVMSGLITAGILAAIMSSLDSQFLCLGSMFTNDIVVHHFGEDHFTDKQKILMARVFTLLIVAVTYLLSLFSPNKVFVLGVWCFSGFAGLFPLVLASLYWKGTTKAGAYACVLATAASWVFFFVRSGNGATEGLVYGMMPVLFIVLISAAALVVVSLFTQPPTRVTLNQFFPPAKAEVS
jgi:SSS family solute:Na+ symporter